MRRYPLGAIQTHDELLVRVDDAAMLTCPKCGFGNSDGARFCSNCGNALEQARHIEGERKFATILFADVAHSTAIAEQLDPEDWAVIMNGAFAFMNAAVSRYGGTVSRLMGDAVLALFGAPVAHEDDAERAVRAGLEIQNEARAYAREVKARYGIDFDLRVGINTGVAVLAFVGDAIRTEYTAMGDAANIAARLQSAADPRTVLISADTHRLVRNLFEFRPRGPMDMRGKQASVETFEVLGIKAVPGKMRGLEGLESPLVGRDREIRLLHERFSALRQGRGSVIAIVGEAGLGKSRLVAELRQRHETEAPDAVAWYETRAISYGYSIPYFPWRSIGRQMIGATETDAAADVRSKLAAWVGERGMRQADIPLYETMLAIDSEQSRLALSALPADSVVNGVAAAVVNAMKTAVQGGGQVRPHVLVMDDLHWSDSATLELIAQVATLASFEPLMLLVVLRPDRTAPSWTLVDRLQASLGSSFDRIDLEPLDPSASGELLGNLLHISDLPPSIRAQILERSEGNPFYLEEVLRSLIDGGQVVKDDGHWRATRDIFQAEIPETLAGVLSARIDRLPENTKRVAQTAAVIGRVFQHRVLETVCHALPEPERVENVEPHIATLAYEQLVRERAREPEREYIFKHALTCEAAYGLLLKSRRRALHARTGQALEHIFGDRRDEFAAMLARHFAEADDLPKAVEYSRRAADAARKLFAAREEVEHRERVLSLLDRMPEALPADVIDATIEWAFVRHQLAQFEGLIDRLEAAVGMARELGDRSRLGVTLSWLASIHMATGFPSRAVPAMIESQRLADETGDAQLLLLPMFFATWNSIDRDPAAAADQLREIIKLARQYKVTDVEGHAMAERALALARIGDFEGARAQIEEALQAAENIKTPIKRADIHIGVGMAYHDMGDLEKGLEHTEIGARLAESVNGFECACAGYASAGRVRLDNNDPDAAADDFLKSLKYADAAQFGGFRNAINGGLALADLRKGNDASVDRLRAAVRNANATNDQYFGAVLSQQLAAALVRQSQYDEARVFLDAALGYYRSSSMRPYLASALELAAQISEQTGRPDEARQQRQEAAEMRAPMLIPPVAEDPRAVEQT